MEDLEVKKGFLGWFAANHVAANLLMALIIAAGLLSIFSVKKEIFPETSFDAISISVPYRGATPEDVEKGVCLRVEEAIGGVEGIKRITSTASESLGTTMAEVEQYSDVQEVLDDIKAAIDRITTFPIETEKPVISELKTRLRVISIVVHGNVSEKTLRMLAEQVRDELTARRNITHVSIAGVRAYEISIEVSERALRSYGLSFDQVADAVRQSSLDIPAGSIKTTGGTFLIRTKGQKYYGPEFDSIVVLTRNDGTKVMLSDIAKVHDEFEDSDLFSKFDGQRAALVHVSRTGEQGALDVADTVKEYVSQKRKSLPEGISLSLWEDDSVLLKSRIDLLKRNGYLGLILVFLVLALFLNFRLAFWTTMGIPISFLGAFYLIPMFGVSINMISLFAFIMSLGLVVDDAIVVGENIFAYHQQGYDRLTAAVKGVKEMAMPVVLAVLTTMFAFIPLAYTTGMMGKILRVFPIVVISVLFVSLIEALLILPAHLAAKKTIPDNIITRLTDRLTSWTERKLDHFIQNRFTGYVQSAVKRRYLTVAIGITIFMITIGYIVGGHIKFVFFDAVEADNIIVELTMPQGTPVEQTREVIEQIEQKALKVVAEVDAARKGKESIMKHIATTVGAQLAKTRGGPDATDVIPPAMAHLAEINIELLGGELRKDISSIDMKNRWRELVGEIPGVSSLVFTSEIMSVGEAVNFELAHRDFDSLLEAVEDLKQILREYEGVSDIADSFEAGKVELQLSLTDAGRAAGLRLIDLARQVRQGFYGEEVQRIQRGRDDIRVMVRYPKDQRKSIADVENMRIRIPGGTEIPFRTVANVKFGRGYAAIRRVDRRRVVNVTADVDEQIANATEINDDLVEVAIPELMRRYPGLKYRFAGEVQERNESLGSLGKNFLIAMFAIYGLLAVQFRSYTQPIIVMSAIPFGIVGATWGHVLMGFATGRTFNLSILSLFGIVAMTGVVVNDSLILIDLINRERKSGVKLPQIIRDCATRRFRPIMLTTMTTFCGLIPMMLERSLQARFLIPMAISLAFGVLFATMITLFLVPSLYLILEDVKNLFFRSSTE